MGIKSSDIKRNIQNPKKGFVVELDYIAPCWYIVSNLFRKKSVSVLSLILQFVM